MKKLFVEDGRLHFRCLGAACPSPCCGPFSGVSDDFTSVFGRDASQIPLTADDERRVRETYGEAVREHLEQCDGQTAVKLNADGSCPFWRGGRCGIYKARPSLCQAFPLYLDMFTGLNVITACPGVGTGWTSRTELDEMRTALMDVYRHHMEVQR